MSLIYFGQKQGEPGKNHSDLDFFFSFSFFLFPKPPLKSLAILGSGSSAEGTVWFCFDSSLSGDSPSCSERLSPALGAEPGKEHRKPPGTRRWKLPACVTQSQTG